MTASRIPDIPMEASTKRSQYAYRCIQYRKDIDSQVMLPVMQFIYAEDTTRVEIDARRYIFPGYSRRFPVEKPYGSVDILMPEV